MPVLPNEKPLEQIWEYQGFTLRKGDCIERMKSLPWHSVDCVVTDPPYGISYQTNHRVVSKTPDMIHNDEDLLVMEAALPIISGKLKPTGCVYCFCSPTNIEEVLPLFRNANLKVKNLLIWDKTNWGAGDLYGSYGSSYEMIVYAVKSNDCVLKKRRADVIREARVTFHQNQYHPNQKPTRLLKRLIRNSTDIGDLVIDPFMGSCSTGIACLQAGRRFWGCELDQKYYDLSTQRVEKYLLSKQQKTPHQPVAVNVGKKL